MRCRFERIGGALSLHIKQEAVLSSDQEVSFEPDIVDVLLNSMKGLIEAIVALIAALQAGIDESVTLVDNPSVSAIEPTVEPDRLVLLARLA